MKLVVTGASGFIGAALVPALIERGHEVVSLTRNVSNVRAGEVVAMRGFDDRDAIERACDGAVAVVHLASRVHVMHADSADDLTEFRRVNVEGTRIVAEIAARSGVRHMVYLSTIKVHGEGRATAYTEADAMHPADPYAVSKCEAERLLENLASLTFGITVLRPPLVYGPRVRANFRRLLRVADLARRLPLPLDGIRNRRSMLFLENLTDAIGRALEHRPLHQDTYLLADGEDLSTSDLVRILSLHLGSHARLWTAPEPAVAAAARLLGRAGELQRLFGALTVDASKFRRAMHWVPPYSADAGLEMTAAWWQRRHQLS